MLQEPQQIDSRKFCDEECEEIKICMYNNPECRAYDAEQVKQWEREQIELDEERKRISDARIKIPLQDCIFALMQANERGKKNTNIGNYCNPYKATLCVYNSFYNFPESRGGKLTYYEDDLSLPLTYLEHLGLAECEYDQIVSIDNGEEEIQPYKTFLSSVRIKATGEVYYSVDGYNASKYSLSYSR